MTNYYEYWRATAEREHQLTLDINDILLDLSDSLETDSLDKNALLGEVKHIIRDRNLLRHDLGLIRDHVGAESNYWKQICVRIDRDKLLSMAFGAGLAFVISGMLMCIIG